MPIIDRLTWFAPASSRKISIAWFSLTAAGKFKSRPSKMLSGTVVAIKSSSDLAPTADNIALTSASFGPICRRAKSSLRSMVTLTLGESIVCTDIFWERYDFNRVERGTGAIKVFQGAGRAGYVKSNFRGNRIQPSWLRRIAFDNCRMTTAYRRPHRHSF